MCLYCHWGLEGPTQVRVAMVLTTDHVKYVIFTYIMLYSVTMQIGKAT